MPDTLPGLIDQPALRLLNGAPMIQQKTDITFTCRILAKEKTGLIDLLALPKGAFREYLPVISTMIKLSQT